MKLIVTAITNIFEMRSKTNGEVGRGGGGGCKDVNTLNISFYQAHLFKGEIALRLSAYQ